MKQSIVTWCLTAAVLALLACDGLVVRRAGEPDALSRFHGDRRAGQPGGAVDLLDWHGGAAHPGRTGSPATGCDVRTECAVDLVLWIADAIIDTTFMSIDVPRSSGQPFSQ